jgi:hypothetical protein
VNAHFGRPAIDAAARLDDSLDTGAFEDRSPGTSAPHEELIEWKAMAEKAAIETSKAFEPSSGPLWTQD